MALKDDKVEQYLRSCGSEFRIPNVSSKAIYIYTHTHTHKQHKKFKKSFANNIIKSKISSAFTCISKTTDKNVYKQKNIYHISTWSMPHSGQNGFAICHLSRTMAIKVCLYDPIYIHTSYLHSYECQLTCNILELLPRLLCNPPTYPSFLPHPLLCPHPLLFLLSHSFFLFTCR